MPAILLQTEVGGYDLHTFGAIVWTYYICWLYTEHLFRLSSMLSETDKTTGLFDALFGRLSAKGLSSRETSEKQSSSIAINGIRTGSDFAPIPWFRFLSSPP